MKFRHQINQETYKMFIETKNKYFVKKCSVSKNNLFYIIKQGSSKWQIDSYHRVSWAYSCDFQEIKYSIFSDNKVYCENVSLPKNSDSYVIHVSPSFEKNVHFVLYAYRDKKVVKSDTLHIDVVDNINKKYQLFKNKTDGVIELKDGASLIKPNNNFLYIGGWNTSTQKTDSDIWSSADTKQWVKLDPAPFSGRHCFGAVKFNGKYWIIGGDGNKGSYQNDIWNSEDGIKWNLVSRNNHFLEKMFSSAFTFRQKIWVVGGEKISSLVEGESKVFNEIWSSEDGIKWKQANLIENRFPPRAEVICNTNFTKKAWIIGGAKYHDYSLNDVWSSIDGYNWVQHPPPPFDEITFHNLQEFDGKIWIIGGVSNFRNTNSIWYTSDGENWFKILNNSLTPSHALSTFVDSTQLYIMGGGQNEFYSIK